MHTSFSPASVCLMFPLDCLRCPVGRECLLQTGCCAVRPFWLFHSWKARPPRIHWYIDYCTLEAWYPCFSWHCTVLILSNIVQKSNHWQYYEGEWMGPTNTTTIVNYRAVSYIPGDSFINLHYIMKYSSWLLITSFHQLMAHLYYCVLLLYSRDCI